jgi:antitoxin CcdA
LSATLERALRDALRAQRRERWLADNKSGIDAYNEQVNQHGAFADTLRSF